MDRSDLVSQLPALLVPWHRAHKRDLPWRTDPSAYHTWLSEIMLQQTRIEAVIPYYQRFLEELPTLEALAAVPEDRLLKLWEGLGYYSRARNLKKAAVAVMEQYAGQLPVTAAQLQRLPGIGAYTAGAIASIAFGQPEPAVDGNVMRVFTRVTGDESDVARASVKKQITEELRRVYPTGDEAGAFTEGLMELGETICLPTGEPRCDRCPLQAICVAHRENITDRIPFRSEKKQRAVQNRTVFLLCCGDRYALRRRPEQGLLSGLWEFPNREGTLSSEEAANHLRTEGIDLQATQDAGRSVHIFTHIEWHMTGVFARCGSCSDGFVWVTSDQLRRDYALPTAFRAYKQWIFDRESET